MASLSKKLGRTISICWLVNSIKPLARKNVLFDIKCPSCLQIKSVALLPPNFDVAYVVKMTCCLTNRGY